MSRKYYFAYHARRLETSRMSRKQLPLSAISVRCWSEYCCHCHVFVLQVDKLVEHSTTQAIRQWRRLPPVISQQHIPLLQVGWTECFIFFLLYLPLFFQCCCLLLLLLFSGSTTNHGTPGSRSDSYGTSASECWTINQSAWHESYCENMAVRAYFHLAS